MTPQTGKDPVSTAAPALGAPELRTSFTRRGVKILYLIPFSLYILILLSGALFSGGFWWARALAGLGVVCLAVFAGRMLRLAVIAEPDCLVVRNFRNTHRIPWRDVEEIFEPGPVPVEVYRENPLARRQRGLFVRLSEGSVVSATLYSDRLTSYKWPSFRQDLTDAVRELNELRRRYGC